ncbi:DUF5615 family PIN-like protein [Halobacteria archaeon AArc-m2/3/4]|uniref:DUF5615 family PIN-like protein n=1 Tax=Natronoglomus mannanivorans TaxID=2979990 RepID=A0ABT2QCC6_9EURY|nr:DUF5615 family PIN-like protein [Halobacteria archaeon AArc-m2/3/4]
MARVQFLADEHIPGPFLTAVDSLGYEVLRVKDEFSEGTADRRLLEFGRETGRVVLTCDTRFTIVDNDIVTDHGGVIYADQAFLQTNPEDAANGIDRIATTMPADDIIENEFYLSDWV